MRPSTAALVSLATTALLPDQPLVHVTTHLLTRRDRTLMLLVVHDEDRSNSRCPHSTSPLCPFLVLLRLAGCMRQPPDHHPRWSHRRFFAPLRPCITAHHSYPALVLSIGNPITIGRNPKLWFASTVSPHSPTNHHKQLLCRSRYCRF